MKTASANPIGTLLREPWIEVAPNLPSVVEKVLEISFDFLEIPEKYNFNPEQLNYLQKLGKEGRVSFTLHSATPGGSVSLTDPKFALGIEHTFQLAETIGAGIVTFDFDSVAAPKDERERYKILQTRVAAIIKAAEKVGTIAAFENGDVRDHTKCGRFKFGMIPEDFHRLIRDFPRLKITLDSGHLLASATYWGFDWKKDFVEPLAPHVVHTHLQNNFCKEGGHGSKSLAGKLGDLHLPLDMGRVPWREIVSLLLEEGYGGVFSLEIKPELYFSSEKEVWQSIKESYRLLSDFVREKGAA